MTSNDDLDFLDEKRDFLIVGSHEEQEIITGFMEDIRAAGMTCWGTMHASCAAWISEGSSGSRAYEDDLRRSRVRLFLYSERAATSFKLYRDPTWLRGHLFPTIQLACQSGPVVVIVLDGKWPLPDGPLKVIEILRLTRGQIYNEIAAYCGPFLISSRKSERALHELGRILASSIEVVTRRTNKIVMVFGPGEPEKLAADRDTMMWLVRERVKSHIESRGWLAVYGEDLSDIGNGGAEKDMNPALKERLVTLGVVAVVVLCASPGAIAEVAVMSQYKEIARKMVIAIDKQHREGFVSKGPVTEARNCGAAVIEYEASIPGMAIVESDIITRVQVMIELSLGEDLRRNDLGQ